MPKKNVIAIDYSGSTNDKKNYWDKVLSVLEKTNGIDTKYIFWDSDPAKIVDKTKAIQMAKDRKGFKYTNPLTFVSLLIEEIKKVANYSSEGSDAINLTIITDGQIYPIYGAGQEDIKKCIANCDQKLKEAEIKFSKVEVYFVNTGGAIDLSVAAPFLRRAGQYSMYQDDKLIKENSQLNLDGYLNEAENFLKNFQMILSQIEAHVLGTDGKAVHISLSNLQKNLLDKVQKDNAEINKNSDLITQIMDELHKRDEKNQAKILVEKLFNKSENTSFNKEKEIAAKFEQLFNACSKGYDFSFDKEKSNRTQKASELQPFKVSQLNQVDEKPFKKDCNFVCPITINKDAALLPIKNYVQQEDERPEYQPIFLGIPKNIKII